MESVERFFIYTETVDERGLLTWIIGQMDADVGWIIQLLETGSRAAWVFGLRGYVGFVSGYLDTCVFVIR